MIKTRVYWYNLYQEGHSDFEDEGHPKISKADENLENMIINYRRIPIKEEKSEFVAKQLMTFVHDNVPAHNPLLIREF